MRQIFLMLLLVVATETATAQFTVSLEPAQAHAGQNVNLRFDDPGGCYPLPQDDVQRAGGVVTVNLRTTDVAPCLPEWTTPQLVQLGTFTPGTYQVQAFVCSNPPPPLPACELRATLPLTVANATAGRFTVPALSGAVAVGMAVLVMMIGALGPRRGE